MVGDNPQRDIKGAKSLGMKTCLAKYGLTYKSDSIKADFEINDIKEVVGAVKEKCQ